MEITQRQKLSAQSSGGPSVIYWDWVGKSLFVVRVGSSHVTLSFSLLTLSPRSGRTRELKALWRMDPAEGSHATLWGTWNEKDSIEPVLTVFSEPITYNTAKGKSWTGSTESALLAESPNAGNRVWSISGCEHVREALRTELYPASSPHPCRTLPGVTN